MVSTLLVALVRAYQYTQPLRDSVMRQLHFPRHTCKFVPTCSENMINQIRKYGAAKGVTLGLSQLMRCV